MTTTRWFTSDLHLGHARINELAGRPFSSVDEMNQAIIDRWNDKVSEGDTVYLLGDICMGKLEDSLALAAQLRGHKRLMPGNHDRVSSLYKGSEAKKAIWKRMYEDAGFEIISEQARFGIWATPVVMCHFPYEGDSHGADRYKDSRPLDEGGWLIHGHTHGRDKVSGIRQIHVGVDAWDFRPANEAEIAALIRASEGAATEAN